MNLRRAAELDPTNMELLREVVGLLLPAWTSRRGHRVPGDDRPLTTSIPTRSKNLSRPSSN